ncbi:hypothetical protein [Microcoleus anatoxicus]
MYSWKRSPLMSKSAIASHSPKVIFPDLIKIANPFSVAWSGTFDKVGDIK